jgi:hypothetical protein
MLQKNAVEPSTLELLIALQNERELKNFHLAGGTSLALQIGHRKSIDLDFFSLYDFETSNLQEFLENKYHFKTDYISINTLKGNIQNIKIDFISHKYQLVKPIIEPENTRLYSIEDIAAMKLNAIAGNGTRSKDFIDIYFILKNNSLLELLGAYKKKYNSRNLLHVVKSLNYFEDIKTDDWPEMILEKKLKLSKIKKVISEHIHLFSNQIKDL